SGLSAKELTASALNYYQSNDYKEALRMFLEALKKDPDIELKYVIVSKLSTIYQQLGMYELANEILSLYLEKKDFKKHPNINILQTKRLFLSNIIRLLKENNIPSLPYEKLPDYIKKKAFIEAKQNR
ncbi:MAG: tetratricopeptide repeat protein, partial [Desulfotomaculum sp.]|nr:tetratricopeptide repeat protein [Desulfotomaculum sp.]